MIITLVIVVNFFLLYIYMCVCVLKRFVFCITIIIIFDGLHILIFKECGFSCFCLFLWIEYFPTSSRQHM